MKNKFLLPLIIASLLAIGGIGAFMFYHYSSLAQRQAIIHNKGESVMPFDLSQTTHIFKKTDTGGIQQVIAKDPKNTQQISLIRMHLQMEAGLFQKGDFRDPMTLHGNSMPGVQELSQGAKNIAISYVDLPNGGQITYNTNDTNLINSIHTWFDAQLSDHGSDAMGM